jgi:hypothetical protein
MKNKFILLILCSFAFISCKPKDLPDEDFIEFAANVERQMHYEDATSAINAFDFEEFEKRVLAEMNLSSKEKKQAINLIRNMENPIAMILDNVKNGADFRFVKFYRKDNEPHVVFRIYDNGMVSLEDWILGVKDGQIMIYDAFLIVSGIYWSDNYRQQLYNRLNVFTDEVINTNKLIDINYLISIEEYSKADSLLYWLMPQMQDNLYARTIELRLASFTDKFEDMEALANRFEQSFPDEKRIAAYYLMQNAIQLGLPDETINQIHKLIEYIGDDPINYLYQAWAFQSANSPKYALESLDSAIHYISGNIGLYLNKMDIYYYNYDYENCVNLLYQIDSLFSHSENDIVFFSENYPLLQELDSFDEWIGSRKRLTMNN